MTKSDCIKPKAKPYQVKDARNFLMQLVLVPKRQFRWPIRPDGTMPHQR
jgi:hypothetical protein